MKIIAAQEHRRIIEAVAHHRYDFSARLQSAHARELAADTFASQILEIVAAPFEDANAINAARLRVDTMKWISSKLKPRSYADRVQAQLTGADGGVVLRNADVSLQGSADYTPQGWQVALAGVASLNRYCSTRSATLPGST